MSTASEVQQKVVKFVQELLLEEADRSSITPTVIEERIDAVVRMQPKWGDGLNRQAVVDELIRRFSLWIGRDTALRNDTNHIQWLDSARRRDWRYWQRYREWLERTLSFKAVEALDHSTDTVLSLLEDPERGGPWDRRGLVVGHVQSGKTGHYTGLICKAADAGYKIVIVLAGLHNNLRSQTQMRLDEGFLGFETSYDIDDIKIIGVGEIDGDPAIRPNFATNRSEKGDFSTAIAKNLGITPEQRPWLFVVKKNKTVLDRLFTWIRDHVANTQDHATKRKLVTHLPLLLIDDEADNASIDTGELVLDTDGKPDANHQPTVINKSIRRILHSFERSAYIGYTATPFANIFIHERGETTSEGPDLFPAAFIINLAVPSNYIGPSKVFGLSTDDDRTGMPVLRIIDDFRTSTGGWMPQEHKNTHQPIYDGQDTIPPSLVQAIDAFILACSIRALRGQENEHCSMLIHVTRYTAVQSIIRRQVEEYLRQIRQRVHRGIDEGPIYDRLRTLWEKDFIPTTNRIGTSSPDLAISEHITWSDIQGVVEDALSDIQVKTINGTAKDALDYKANDEKGLKAIAIGGDKLARGLTLEGLCISYFLRASTMYDTLMQMGRWFGYRPGYLDLCRLYTTAELRKWFAHITDAAEELRDEFNMMAASGATPRDYGLKVQSHSVLMVTSRLKMRTARNLMLSFSGQLLETVAFYRDGDTLQRNLDAVAGFLAGLPSPEVNPKRTRNGSQSEWQGYLWENIPAAEVIAFLGAYHTHPDAYRVNSAMIAEFIASLANAGELTRWTVALIGGGQGRQLPMTDSLSVTMLQRSSNSEGDNRISIRRLMSPRDEAIDLDENAWNAALTLTREAWQSDPRTSKAESQPDSPNGPAIRKIRGSGNANIQPRPDKGTLILYAIDPNDIGTTVALPSDSPPIMAFGISFPTSRSGVKVEYKVNNILWEQEYGPSE